MSLVHFCGAFHKSEAISVRTAEAQTQNLSEILSVNDIPKYIFISSTITVSEVDLVKCRSNKIYQGLFYKSLKCEEYFNAR